MDLKTGSEYIDFLEQFTSSKKSKKFHNAFAVISNKLADLRRKHSNTIENDFMKDALNDIKDFWEYSFNTIFETLTECKDVEMRISGLLEENHKYASLLIALGATPMLYFTISDSSIDFIIENHKQIGFINMEQLVDIDLALTVHQAVFQTMPEDYNSLKQSFDFIQKTITNDNFRKLTETSRRTLSRGMEETKRRIRTNRRRRN